MYTSIKQLCIYDLNVFTMNKYMVYALKVSLKVWVDYWLVKHGLL